MQLCVCKKNGCPKLVKNAIVRMLTWCFIIYRGLQFINTGFLESNLYPEEEIVTNNHFYLESKLRQTTFWHFIIKSCFQFVFLLVINS